MPGFDQTGPLGEGPQTGRGLGRCGTGDAGPARGLYGVGRGGRPWGGGRGRCFGGGLGFPRFAWPRGANVPAVPDVPAGDETALRTEIRSLADEVAALRAELAALKGADPRAEEHE